VQNLVGSPPRHKQAEDLKPKICTSEKKKTWSIFHNSPYI
jgi:hypothetical protein